MIASPAATPIEIVLDVVTDNWSSWYQALKQLCFTEFCEDGQQILSNTLIPLYPFAIEPTKDNLHVDPIGTPIPGAFIYSCRSLTLEEAAIAPPINQTPLHLSTQGSTNLRDDRKIFAESKRRSSDDDTECLDHLYRHMSVASHTSVKTHVDYPTYQLLPIGVRSYPFFMMLRDIHSTGNAATKLHRTRLFINVTQHDLSHEAYMDLVISGAETFKLDFESTAYPGYVSLPELTSFLYLAGVDKELFRRPIDQLLISTPSDRFPDPTALMAQLQAWKLPNALSFVRDTISTQGSALIATKPPPLTPRIKKDGARKKAHCDLTYIQHLAHGASPPTKSNDFDIYQQTLKESKQNHQPQHPVTTSYISRNQYISEAPCPTQPARTRTYPRRLQRGYATYRRGCY
jgi:hypothetical protein